MLNLLRKTALNLAKSYKTKNNSKSPVSGILKNNLFDVNNLASFIQFLA